MQQFQPPYSQMQNQQSQPQPQQQQQPQPPISQHPQQQMPTFSPPHQQQHHNLGGPPTQALIRPPQAIPNQFQPLNQQKMSNTPPPGRQMTNDFQNNNFNNQNIAQSHQQQQQHQYNPNNLNSSNLMNPLTQDFASSKDSINDQMSNLSMTNRPLSQQQSNTPQQGQRNSAFVSPNGSNSNISHIQNQQSPISHQQQQLSGPPLMQGPPQQQQQQQLSGSPMNFPQMNNQQQHNRAVSYGGASPMMGQGPRMPQQGPPMPVQPMQSQPINAGPPIPGQPMLSGPMNPLNNQQQHNRAASVGGPQIPGNPPMNGINNYNNQMGPQQNQFVSRQPMPGAPFSQFQQQQPMNNQFQPQTGYNQQQQQPPQFNNQQQQFNNDQQQFQQQQQQNNKMDLDLIPNPIEVMQANKTKYGGSVFETNESGKVPPLSSTDFICKDMGNCNPAFIRSTTYSVPSNPDLIKQSKVPIALAINPFAQLKEQEVNFLFFFLFYLETFISNSTNSIRMSQ
jgi:hypothetical protein